MTKDCSVNSPKNTSSEHVVYNYLNVNFCTQHALNFSGNLMNNLLSYCGLTDARMRAIEKDLAVSGTETKEQFWYRYWIGNFFLKLKLYFSTLLGGYKFL